MKKTITVFLALLFCVIMAACGSANKNEATVNTTTTESTTEGTTVPTTDPVKKDWNVTPIDDALSLPFDDGNGGSPEINGYYVEFDDVGIHLIEAKTGNKTDVTTDGSWIYAFDGKTIMFCQKRADPTVDFDKNYVIAYDDKPIKPTVYEVDDIMAYDVATGKTEKLFTKYCAGGGIVYFNDDVIYYDDIKESQIGYKNGYDPYILYLYSYDRASGERKIVLEDSFDMNMEVIAGKPCLEMEDGVYDISTATPGKLFDPLPGAYHWCDGQYIYSVGPENDETYAIWACNMADGAREILKEYEFPEEMQYVAEDFGLRYVLCGADISKQENELTTSYGASKYSIYDLMTRKTIVIDPNEYDGLVSVNGVLVSWIDEGDGTYQVGYYDDDGNQEFYDTWKLNGDLYRITAEGYYVQTGEDKNEEPILRFVSAPLEFLQD